MLNVSVRPKTDGGRVPCNAMPKGSADVLRHRPQCRRCCGRSRARRFRLIAFMLLLDAVLLAKAEPRRPALAFRLTASLCVALQRHVARASSGGCEAADTPAQAWTHSAIAALGNSEIKTKAFGHHSLTAHRTAKRKEPQLQCSAMSLRSHRQYRLHG